MPSNLFVKLDASYHEDEKILLAGEKAELLYVRGLCLAKRILSDGFVADVQLSRFGLSGVHQRVRKLVEVGLWTRDDDAKGYWIAAWSKWNDSAGTVSEKRDKKREAGAKGRHTRWHVERDEPDPDCRWCQMAGANGKAMADANGMPDGTEAEAEAEAEADTADEAADQFEEHFWPAYPARNGRKLEKGKALTQWRKLSLEERRRALIGARNLAASDTLPKDAHRFLRKDTAGEFPFDDWQTSVTRLQQANRPAPPPRPCPQCGDQYVPDNFDGGVPASHGCETGETA